MCNQEKKVNKEKKILLCFDVVVEYWHWVAGPGKYLLTDFWGRSYVAEMTGVPTTSSRRSEVCMIDD